MSALSRLFPAMGTLVTASLVRTVIATIATVAGTMGFTASNELQAALGAIVTAGVAVYSVWEKVHLTHRARDAISVAVQTPPSRASELPPY